MKDRDDVPPLLWPLTSDMKTFSSTRQSPAQYFLISGPSSVNQRLRWWCCEDPSRSQSTYSQTNLSANHHVPSLSLPQPAAASRLQHVNLPKCFHFLSRDWLISFPFFFSSPEPSISALYLIKCQECPFIVSLLVWAMWSMLAVIRPISQIYIFLHQV